MIAYLTGEVLGTRNGSLILIVAGVGYLVSTTEDITRKATPGTTLALYTHHHVREDADDLYGFATPDELELFQLLISVSGVGPKTGLAALSVTSAANIRQAIGRGDATILKAISGIGPKTAQRIVVELKDKMGVMSFSSNDNTSAAEDAEVVEALVGLGYSQFLAREAVMGLDLTTTTTPQEKIKKALQILSRNR